MSAVEGSSSSEGLRTFPTETTDVQSRFVIAHQLRASADIQDDETKRETGWATTSDRAGLMREAADTIERLAALQPSSAADAKPVAWRGDIVVTRDLLCDISHWLGDHIGGLEDEAVADKVQDVRHQVEMRIDNPDFLAQPHPSQQAGVEGIINEWVSAEVANNIHGSMAGDEVVTAECAVEIARGAALRALAALKPVEG